MTVSERHMPVASVDGPTIGMLGQFGVLAALAATVGLGPVGWLTGAVFALVTWGFLSRGLRRAGMLSLGAANQVTLARATLVGGVTALVVEALFGGPGHGQSVPVAVLVSLASVALALDGVDGQVARRTGTTSSLGARFDMEVDAVLALVLSIFVAGSLGWWVLTIGALRYAFVAAAWVMPWLREPLPPKFSRKVVAATQGVLLLVVGAGFLPSVWSYAVVGVALGLLTWSFGRDVGWLARTHLSRVHPVAEAIAGTTVQVDFRPRSGAVPGR